MNQKESSQMSEKSRQTDFGRMTELLRAKVLGENRPRVLPTQFEALDNILCGGLREGITCLSGASGVGKSALAATVAAGIARSGNDVALFCFGSTRSDVASVAISERMANIAGDMVAGIPCFFLDTYSPKEYPADENELIDQASAEVSVYIDKIHVTEAAGSTSFAEMKKALDKLSGASAVIIDGIDELVAASRVTNDRNKFARIVLDLRGYAMAKHIPILFTYRISDRDLHSEDSSAPALRHFETICSICDAVIDLHPTIEGRECVRDGGDDLDEPIEEALMILKNRRGTPGSFTAVEYYPQHALFVEKR